MVAYPRSLSCSVRICLASMDSFISTSGVVDVVRNAFSFAMEEFKRVWYLNDEINRISREVATLIQDQGAMEAAEKKQLQDEDVRKWVRDLKNVRYDLEDVRCDYDVVVSAEDGQGVRTQWMRLAKDGLYMVCGVPLSCLGIIPDPVTPRIEIAHRLKSINRNLVEINKRKAGLRLDGGMVGEGNESDPLGPPMWQYQERPMIGRTETKIQIKEALLNYAGNEGSCSKLFVIGIVGAGGMGKTTLAHNIYNDEDVVKAFPNNNINKWLYVGEKFDLMRVLNEIIGEGSQLVRQDDLHSAMREKFKDQSLLIVLDDVWCDNSVEWDLLQSSLSKGAKAHALIVTTRNKAVARAIPHDSKYSEVLLEGLPDTECMDIFKRGAFKGDGAERYRDELEGLSKRVVQKLKGNPLAATMMGTFLHKHLGNRQMWLNIVNDVIGWPHTDGGNMVDRVVGLSYFHLPPDLKSCFAYCALFPKGFVFDEKTLVQMWITQGYVQPPGSDHFEDLYQRSFFQIGTFYHDYIMHDLIHDFAQKVFTEGCRMDASDTEDSIRHLSFYDNGTDQLKLKRLDKFKKLRTLLLKSDVTIAAPQLVVLAKFKYLRLLVLDVYKLSEFPDSIRHLKFLRYLDISRTVITALPELVCDLVELQCLKLPSDCALPEGMDKLINLRYIKAGDEEFPQFKGIGQLTFLQGPLAFKVHKKSGWKISELKGLNHLHGRLIVHGLGDVTCKEEAEQACLTQKVYLEELVLSWAGEEEEGVLSSGQEEHVVDGQVQQHVRNDEVESQVLEGLFSPPNLKHLRICNNRGARFPCWMEEHDGCPISSSLVTLELVGCCKWECLPTLGRWPCLRELVIIEAHGVKKIGPEFFYGRGRDNNNSGRSYFPRLEMLVVKNMSLWEEWEMPAARELDSSDGGCGRYIFLSLKKLHIYECPKLHSLSPVLHHLTNLETFSIMRCGELASLYDGCGSTPLNFRLKYLIIQDCPKLALLAPILRHSTDLKSIQIQRCAELTLSSWEEGDDGRGSTSFPSRLKELVIQDCPKLASLAPILRRSTNLERIEIYSCAELTLSSWEEGDDGRGWMLHSLKYLSIEYCPKLASLAPILRHSTDLVSIKIDSCAELALSSWEEGDDGRGWMFHSLKYLSIGDCPKLASLAPILRHSADLKILEIRRCAELAGSSWEEGDDGREWMLPSKLKTPVILECPKLAPFLLRHSTDLERSVISKCAEEGDDDGRGWMLPSGLKWLTVDGSSWKLLPSLSHLTALQDLEIGRFPNLRCIPSSVHSLRSLLRLELEDCPAIERLPDGGLPPWLKMLIFVRCPLLEERYREGGLDRPKIPTTTRVFFEDS